MIVTTICGIVTSDDASQHYCYVEKHMSVNATGVTFESIVCHRARLLVAKLNSDLACKTIRT